MCTPAKAGAQNSSVAWRVTALGPGFRRGAPRAAPHPISDISRRNGGNDRKRPFIDIKRGRRNITINLLFALAEGLGVPPGELFRAAIKTTPVAPTRRDIISRSLYGDAALAAG